MLLAPGVAPSRSPSHTHAPSQGGLFPQFFCQPVLPRALSQLAHWMSASNCRSRKNGAMLVVVVSHSLIRVDHHRKRNFLPRRLCWTCCGRTHPFIFLASAWTCLRSMQPRQSTGQRLRYPSAQANFTKIDQASASWGKARSCGTPRPLLERGARQGKRTLCSDTIRWTPLALTLHLQRLGLTPKHKH